MATTFGADQDALHTYTERFELRSGVDSSGAERDFIEGFLATTHVDKGNDQFTVNALKSMADDINEGAADEIRGVFNDVDEAQIGNLDHNNNPASPFGDTRTVPAFKIQEAEVRDMEDGEKGLWIKGVLNTGGMQDSTVSAVKNSIQDGFIDSLSVEFIAEKVQKKFEDNEAIRVIEEAAAKGAALTARPMNAAAKLTDAMLKSQAVQEYKVEYAFSVGDDVNWNETGGTIRDRIKDGQFDDEIDGDFTVTGSEEDPAYLIEVDNDEGTMVAHKQSFLVEEGNKADLKQLSEEQRTPPEAAQENAEMFLNAKEEGEVPDDCGTGAGTETAEMLAEGEPLSESKISDIASFARHEDNKEADVDEGETRWKDCGFSAWKAWGGDEGVRWAQDKNEMADESKTGHSTKAMQLLYDTEEEARAVAGMLGLEGMHKHEMDGTEMFMPGESHEAYLEAVEGTEFAELVPGMKAEMTIQSPEYAATSESGQWERPDMEDFPEDYNPMDIFIVRSDSDNFSDQSLPVVGMRDGEPTLVLGGLESAHTTASRVEGLSDDEVQRARSRIEQLAEDEFGVDMDMEGDSAHMDEEDKNDAPMADKPEQEPDEGSEDGEADEAKSEAVSVKEDVEELKSLTEDLKETNEQLREENEELKSELQDLKQIQEVKNDLDEVKSILDDVKLEDGPRAQQEQKRGDNMSGEDSKTGWKQKAEGMKSFLKRDESYVSDFAENHDIKSEEVNQFIND